MRIAVASGKGGTGDRTKLESLMARGLDEDEAMDLIIRSMIR
jgi:Fe-S cluster assembly scaffold protein SufB